MSEKKTPLYQVHIDSGAKMIEFGGWLMPVQYSGIIEEHNAVRNKAGLFDVSHMGEFIVKGKDALPFLQKVLTNDLSTIVAGQAQYSPMCYENGGTVDDLLIYKYDDNEYLLVVNAGNIDKDWQWLNKQSGDFDISLQNVSDEVGLLSLQGPLAEQILSSLTDANLKSLKFYRFLPRVMVAGCEVTLSRTGYTGEDGFEIYCKAEDSEKIWRAILKAGKAEGVLPVGLGSRDTLRFEAGLPLYGHELTVAITPVEAGIGMFVKVDKGDFIGSEQLVKQKTEGVEHKVVGFMMTDRGIARADYKVFADGKQIGKVTSGSPAPTLGKNLGLALVNKEYANIGQKIEIDIRGKLVSAEIIKKPFYKRGEN